MFNPTRKKRRKPCSTIGFIINVRGKKPKRKKINLSKTNEPNITITMGG